MSLRTFLQGGAPALRTNGGRLPNAQIASHARELALTLMRPAHYEEALELVREGGLPADPRDAWESCAARDLIPDTWIDDPSRQFYTRCADCQGAGVLAARGRESSGDPACGTCASSGVVPCEHPLTPPSALGAAMLALNVLDVTTAEQLAHEAATQLGWPSDVVRWRCVDEGDVQRARRYSGAPAEIHWGGFTPLHPQTLGQNTARWRQIQTLAETPFEEALRPNASYVQIASMTPALYTLRKRIFLTEEVRQKGPSALEAMQDQADMARQPVRGGGGVYGPLHAIWRLGFGVLLRERTGDAPIILLLAPLA